MKLNRNFFKKNLELQKTLRAQKEFKHGISTTPDIIISGVAADALEEIQDTTAHHVAAVEKLIKEL